MHEHGLPHGSPVGEGFLRVTRVNAPHFVDDAGAALAYLVRETERAEHVRCRYAMWLDSASAGIAGGAPSRWSVFGLPTEVLRYDDAGRRTPRVEVLSMDGSHRETCTGTILDVLDRRLATPDQSPRLKSSESVPEEVRDVVGAWFGYLGYEVAEDLEGAAPYTADTPDAVWMRSERLVMVDHHSGQSWVVGDRDWIDRVHRAAEVWEPPVDVAIPKLPLPDRGNYLRAVEESLEEIRQGNSYEVCLTAESRGIIDMPWGFPEVLGVYRGQRRGNPAPHAAFLWCDDVAVLSSSPERFISVNDQGWCEAKPIKGTVRRCPDPAEDARAAEWLAHDPKSRAENLMIVDLMRNDFSMVCDPASVHVPVLMGIESYSTVHQLVSTVRGRLAEGRTVIDMLRAAFPGGSMTGAPKPRTLEIIQRLERRARGVYSGALGVLGRRRSDVSIVIRTAVLTPGADGQSTEISVSAGGAVVADSDPAAEYEEMLTKLEAPLRRIAQLEDG